jgi:hypothetical protein
MRGVYLRPLQGSLTIFTCICGSNFLANPVLDSGVLCVSSHEITSEAGT